jgi:mannose-6-phosphate isomerase-like protein (cupin superfamily)
MVDVKNPFEIVNANPGRRHIRLWDTENGSFWVINADPNIQDDMHYHENDDHIFLVLEGEGVVRTPENEIPLKPTDIVVLTAHQTYQLCNTGKKRLLLLGAGNQHVKGEKRYRVPKMSTHSPVTEPIEA